MMLAAAAAVPHAGGAEFQTRSGPFADPARSFRRGPGPSSFFSPAGMQRAPPLRLHGGLQEYDPLGIAIACVKTMRLVFESTEH